MKNLQIQSDFRKLQNEFYDNLGQAVNDYYRERIEIMIENGLNPNDLKNVLIDDIRAKYDQWRLSQPF